MSKTLEMIKEFRRGALKSLYDQCTYSQQQMFNRMYGSVEEIEDSKIDWAIQQCERTILSNEIMKPKESIVPWPKSE